MSIEKSAVTLQAAATNAAAATTTGSAVDLTGALGLSGTARITNGATGPTVGCTFSLEVSGDGSTWRPWCSLTAGVTASTSYDFQWSLPPEILQARAVFTGNTGQAVTVECLGHKLADA